MNLSALRANNAPLAHQDKGLLARMTNVLSWNVVKSSGWI